MWLFWELLPFDKMKSAVHVSEEYKQDIAMLNFNVFKFDDLKQIANLGKMRSFSF